MPKNIVLTLTGKDKIGLVDQITNVVVKRGGNVESSRMARLGGEFAMLMLIRVADHEFANLDTDFSSCRSEGYQVTLVETEDDSKKYAGWLPYEIEVNGADHEGIIQKISHHLASQGINIENMDTSSSPAPMSGTPLFMMRGVILVPPNLNFHKWIDALEEIGDQLNVTVDVDVVK